MLAASSIQLSSNPIDIVENIFHSKSLEFERRKFAEYRFGSSGYQKNF